MATTTTETAPADALAPPIPRSNSPTLYSATIAAAAALVPAPIPATPSEIALAPPPAPSIQDDAYSYTADPARNNDDAAAAETAAAEPVGGDDSVIAPVVEQSAPKLSVTLLLVSGRRRTLEFEPTTAIRELKESVWSTWPADWSDELPPSAAFLRILYLGRILTDETTLSSLNLPPPPESTVVHVSVRCFAPTASDDDLKKKKSKRRGTGRRGRNNSTANDGTAPGGTGDATDERAEAEDEAGGGCCGGCIIC